ncbi:MAG TPA: DUF4838 domain-containing protein [bacterium]|nr:DUF4838 domain-containing protein [bacterium]
MESMGFQSINIPLWAGEAELFAAQELACYIKKITGADLLIRRGLKELKGRAIVIADISHPASKKFIPGELYRGLKYDGYHIKSAKGNLYIVSREPGGVVFGTYEYLKRFYGCAFLDYGERGETVPRRELMNHGEIDVIDNPACWYRGMQASTAEDEKALLQRVDWMAKNGFSHLLMHLKEGTTFDNVRSWLVPALAKRGMKLAYGHHLFWRLLGDKGYEDHEKFYRECPEFYPLIDGKRIQGEKKSPTGLVFDRQLCWCFSNEDLADILSRNIIEIVRKNPEADIVSFWPDDGWAPDCQCEACRSLVTEQDRKETCREKLYPKGKRGDRGKMRKYLHLANSVAGKLAQVYPKVKLSVLSYIDLADPPVGMEIHPNIRICLAIYGRCSKHVLTESSCDINSQYAEIINEWLKVIPAESFYLYTYEMGMNSWRSLPWPVVKNLFEEWQWLKKKGIGGTHIQSATGHIGVYGLNYLAVSHLLREKTASFEKFISDYSEKFFGAPAAPFMEKLILRWEERMRSADREHIGPSPVYCLNPIFRGEDLEYCRSLCEKALKSSGNALNRWRIERIYSLLEYVEIYGRAEEFYGLMLKKKLKGKKKKELENWLDELNYFINEHIAIGDDIFVENFAPKLRKTFLKS